MLGRKALTAIVLMITALPGLTSAQENGKVTVSDFLPTQPTHGQTNGTPSLANGFQIKKVATLYEHLKQAEWRQSTSAGLSHIVAESNRRWEMRYHAPSEEICVSCVGLTADEAETR